MTFTGYFTALDNFIGHLRTRSQVVSFCTSDHVYPLKAPKDIGNCIVYSLVDNEQPSYYSGSFGLSEMYLQVDMYSTSYNTVSVLSDALYQIYHGFNGQLTYNDPFNNNQLVTSIIYGKINVLSINSTLQSINNDIYRQSLDFILTY